MRTTTDTPPARLPSGGVWGTVIGCCSWSLVLVLVLLTHGATEAALTVGLASVMISACFAALTITVLSAVVRREGLNSRAYMEALAGLLTLFLGVIFLLANLWISPALQSAHIVTTQPHPIFGYTTVPTWMPLVALAISTVLLIRCARRAHCGTQIEREETPSA